MNREVFLLNHGDLVHTSDILDEGLGILARGLHGKRDVTGKAHVSFIPFIFLMKRQLFSAFDHLASYQAYQAWMMVRPAVEIPLIMGKWVSDPATKDIWMRRDVEPDAYRREFSGKRLQSPSLPHSGRIQSVLRQLNDQFVHPNPFYYHRHLQIAKVANARVTMEVDYFDLQDEVESHVLAFLHLMAIVHDSVRKMLVDLVGEIPNSKELIHSLEENFQDRVDKLRATDQMANRLLVDLGCWPDCR